MSFDLDATATARLRSAGQRYTTQRRRLIELLADAGSPVSIPDILAGGSGLKQSSVYRNLAALEQAGVVRRLVTDEEFGRYELAEDLIGHHHHLVCSRCGKMRDATIAAATTTNIRPDQGHLHLYLDDQIESMNFSTSATLPAVKPGLHVLRVEFVASDHLPFDPRVIAQVAFEVKR